MQPDGFHLTTQAYQAFLDLNDHEISKLIRQTSGKIVLPTNFLQSSSVLIIIGITGTGSCLW
jgi:hypothetical protein